MVAVITGDIVNSRRWESPEIWMNPFKNVLSLFGTQGEQWEIIRGDMFQLELSNPEDALKACYRIKSHFKSSKDLDCRMSIGIGSKSYNAPRISEASGEAYLRSGDALDGIDGRKQSIVLNSPWPNVDRAINLYLRLALVIMDRWTPGSAETVSFILDHPELNQVAMADVMGISQPSVSSRIGRAHYSELAELELYYRAVIEKHLSS